MTLQSGTNVKLSYHRSPSVQLRMVKHGPGVAFDAAPFRNTHTTCRLLIVHLISCIDAAQPIPSNGSGSEIPLRLDVQLRWSLARSCIEHQTIPELGSVWIGWMCFGSVRPLKKMGFFYLCWNHRCMESEQVGPFFLVAVKGRPIPLIDKRAQKVLVTKWYQLLLSHKTIVR